MVKYLFEDNANADLSVLFRGCIKDSSCLYYAQGDGKIIDKYKEIVTENDFIIVFIDVVPDNRNTRKLYFDLRREFTREGNCIVMPILCAEYLFLKSVINKDSLFIDYSETLKCLGGCNVTESEWLCKLNQRMGFKKTNYEKYCKNIVRFNTAYNCLKPASDDIKKSGYYYRNKCSCSDCLEHDSLEVKSLRYIKQYRLLRLFGQLDFDKVFDIHKELVNEYNESASSYFSTQDNVSCLIPEFDINLYNKEKLESLLSS